MSKLSEEVPIPYVVVRVRNNVPKFLSAWYH